MLPKQNREQGMLNTNIMLQPKFKIGDYAACVFFPNLTVKIHTVHLTKKKVRYDLDVEWYDLDIPKDELTPKNITRFYNIDSEFVVDRSELKPEKYDENQNVLPKDIVQRLDDLKEVVKANVDEYNSDRSTYQLGISNGLIYATHILLDSKMEYLKESESWLDGE